METYTALRQFADSWAVVAFMIFLAGMVLFLFRPGNRDIHRDIANTVFRNDDRPASDSDRSTEEAGGRTESEAR